MIEGETISFMKVSIIGATGYTGAELLRILANHKEAEIICLTSESQTGGSILEIYPHLKAVYAEIPKLNSLNDLESIAKESQAVFIALPHGHAMEAGKKLINLNKDIKIIDLGADYRFKDYKVYEKWYKVTHTYPEAQAVYGLVELNRDTIKNQSTSIIANPGCYTTASILALTPLVKRGLIELNSIIVDAKSGVSGAGRGLNLGSHFCEVFESVKAYGIASHRHTPEIEQELSKLAGSPVTINFTPHLIPMARGILSTCYANMAKGITAKDIGDAFVDEYGDEYFIRLLGERGYPVTKNTRGSNFCDIGWHIDERTKRVIIVSALDNLVKGAAGQAVQNLNLLFEIKAGITAPQGFKAAGAKAGVKKSGKNDVGIIYSDLPAAAAALFTTNKIAAAPILVSKEIIESSGYVSAVVVNSGCANACTGEQGLSDAKTMATVTAEKLNLKDGQVLVASTGVIGVNLPIAKITDGIKIAAAALAENDKASEDVMEAIMTTDTFPKSCAYEFTLEGKIVKIAGIAKGSGMIHPNMATMLAFITTDAAISPELLKQALLEAAGVSFNMISVDGDTSTNDMVCVLANGLAGNTCLKSADEADYQVFLAALKAVCTDLAKLIVRDGEGATKFLEITVEEAASFDEAKEAAMSIAKSPLVKTAFFGQDPNWGRILCALGYSSAAVDPDAVSLTIGSMPIVINGQKANALIDTQALKQIMAARDIVLDTKFLTTLLDNDYIPVIAPSGVGKDGSTYNINADSVAGEIASALGAEKLALLTDVEGIYADYKDKSTFISTMSLAEAQDMIKSGKIEGGMIPKVEACIKALAGGVGKTHILDGRKPHSLLLEIFTTEAGIAVNILGHAHPRLVEAISTQAAKLIHCSNLYYTEPQAVLAVKLTKLSGLNKAFIANSGCEANEGAIKLARKYGKLISSDKVEIITADNSFHGRTLATLTATGQPKYQKGYEPLPGGFKYVPFNDIAALENVISDKTCAVLLEPVQGEGGVKIPTSDYFLKVRQLCDKYQALLILDEIQTGMGRTGKMFAFEHYNIKPDIVTLAKGLAGGMPIGAFISSDETAKAFNAGDHGTTFGGNPLACSAALAVLDSIEKEGILANVETMGEYLISKLNELKAKYPKIIEEIRGMGLIAGAKLNRPGRSIVDKCLSLGVIINCTAGDVLRFVPPLNIEQKHIDQVIQVLDEVLSGEEPA
ncbi:aminotransferase class iii [Holotrichia oblita]|nr:aminotransferase class iii [Holotrichia oblita]